MKPISLAVVLAILSLDSVAAATTFQFKIKEAGESAAGEIETLTITTDVENRRLRMDPGDAASVLFRADQPDAVIELIDHRDRSTRRLTRKQMKQLAGRMSQVTRQTEATLENLPPEHRERIRERQDRAHSGAAKAPSGPVAEVTHSTKRGKVGAYGCTWYEISRGADRTRICATSWDEIANSRSALELVREMIELQHDMSRAFSSGMSAAHERSDPMSPLLDVDMRLGFPVRFDTFERDRRVLSVQLNSVTDAPRTSEFFESPAGYELKTLGSLEGRVPGPVRRR